MPQKLSEVAIRLHPKDNIAVARKHIDPNVELTFDGRSATPKTRILLGHKFALDPIETGGPVYKFGQIIGFASKDIKPGEHVHVHNVSCDNFERDYAYATAAPPRPVADRPRFFDGYARDNGAVGTRNYIAIVSTVNCSATGCRAIADRFKRDGLAKYPNVDGIVAVTHQTGCGMTASGTDREHLQRTLAGYSRHANVFDYLVIGLGCEVNQGPELVSAEKLTARTAPLPRVISIQGAGGIQKTIDAGVEAIAEILPRANDVKRTKQPAERMILGTECGGSDGNSGVTANPALGFASDLLVAQGGTSILSETPEIYGAEHLLTRRAVSRAIGEKLVERIKWWEWYTSILGGAINNNPSHGNKEGGLTTIYEKSLGAVAKGGTTALVDVYKYAEPVTAKGFVVMDTPGYDPPSVTGMVAGGANMVVFTTGRGSVFGCKPVPSIKVATNTLMYEHMIDDMDFNAGVILDGAPLDEVGSKLFDLILEVASGKKTKSEAQGVGDEEFIPWMVGPVL